MTVIGTCQFFADDFDIDLEITTKEIIGNLRSIQPERKVRLSAFAM